MDTNLTSAVVDSLRDVFDNGKDRGIVWWLASHDPLLFIDAAAAQGSFSAMNASTEVLKLRVIETSKANYDFNNNYMGKINLIKAHRSLTHAGLKESKDWVEANFNFPEY